MSDEVDGNLYVQEARKNENDPKPLVVEMAVNQRPCFSRKQLCDFLKIEISLV